MITIAHRYIFINIRLNTIADYDKVLLIDRGILLEYGSPYSLLAKSEDSNEIDKDTEFSKLVLTSGVENS